MASIQRPIQLRRDTAANWTTNDPVLRPGEAGFETDTVKLKIGDGVTAWSALAYFPQTSLSVTQLASSTVLPAATGSGSALIYEVGSATTINLTGPSGTVGGVATYVASNHGAGAKLLLVDSAAGAWDVSELGAPASRTLARYSVSGVAAGVSLVVGANILPIGSLVTSDLISSGQSVAGEHDPLAWRTANQITVSKAGRYRVDLNAVHSTDNLSGASGQDAVGVSRAGIRINGTAIEWIGMDDTAGLADQMSGFVVRSFALGDAIDVVVNATSAAAGEDFYVSFAMEEQPSTESVQAGTIVPTLLAMGQTADAAITTGQTTTSTAFVDIIGAAVTLPQAGTYEIEYVIPTNHATVGAATTTVLTDSLNNPIAGTYCEMGEANGGGITGPNRGRATVTVTGPATYKVRWRTGSGTSTLFNAPLAGGSAWVRYEQKAAATTVNPDTVPVNLLHRLTAISTTSQAAGTMVFNSGHVTDSSGLSVNASNQFVVAQSGAYRVSLTAEIRANSGFFENTTVSVLRNGSALLSTPITLGEVDGSGVFSAHFVFDRTIPLTVGDLISFSTTGGSITVNYKSVVIQEIPTSSVVAVTPGDVVYSPLAQFRAHQSSGTPQSIPNATSTKLVFGTQAYNVGGAFNTTTSTFTAPVAGKYHFDFSARIVNTTGSSSGDYYVRLVTSAGQEIRSGLAQMGGFTWGHGSGDLMMAAGETATVEFLALWGTTVTINGSALTYFSGHQLAENLVYAPDTVPANTLSRAFVVQTADQTTGLLAGNTITFQGAVPVGDLPFAAGVFTLEAGKKYALTAGVTLITGTELIYQWRNITSGTLIGAAGNTHSSLSGRGTVACAELTAAVATTVRLEIIQSNTVTGINAANGRGAWARVEELQTHTVIRPEDTAVNDQTASGYFDIGTMRMQWGRAPSASGARDVTLPVPFANNTYSVTGNSTTSTNVVVAVPSSTRTTTTFRAVTTVTNGPADANAPFDWIAIGQKP